MRCVRALLVLLFVLVVAGLPAIEAPAKAKKPDCKGARVPVTVGKKTTCVPIGKALPKPKTVDVRVAELSESLRFARFGATGKRAQRKLLAVLPRALARIDRAGAGKRAPLGGALATASACSANGPLDQAGSVGGVGVAAAGDNGGQLTVKAGGQIYRLRFASCAGTAGLYVPECPTAAGDVKARSRTNIEITEEILDGAEVLMRRNTQIETKEKGHGKVAADAKLEHIDYDWERETFIVATGGIVDRGKIERHVRVRMPGGAYDPADASVRASGDAKASEGAESFAGALKDAIRDYRFAENGGDFLHTDGWTTFKRQRGAHCAQPVFSAPIETLKLKKGKRDQLGIFAKARADGGRASGAKWTLLTPINASFDPASVDGAAPSFSYQVTNAPPGGKVQVTVKFTSTAGVGEKTWTQPTEPGAAVNQIEGSFGGEVSQGTATGTPSVQKWTGTVSLTRFAEGEGGADGLFLVSGGDVSIVLSGTEGSGITGCLQSGSAQGPLSSGSIVVTGTGPEQGPPYSYSMQVSMPFIAVKATRHTCPPGAEEWEGTQFDASPIWSLDAEGEESADGLSYVGSDSLTLGSMPPFVSSFEEHWTLQGKP